VKNRAQIVVILAVCAVPLVWILWFAALLAPSNGFSSLLKLDSTDPFKTLGPFGDAFGPIASLMATIAASGALYAFISDRSDRRLQSFESNFFILLSNLESITRQSSLKFGRKDKDVNFSSKYKSLERIATRKIVKEFEGRNALLVIVYRIREKVGIDGYRDVKEVYRAYTRIFGGNVNTLGHYFRTIHHICRLIDERCPGDKQYYARILRAQLSNEEICLLAYNCIVGEGRLKFARLAISFSLFHNLHNYENDQYASAELRFFRRKLPNEAFRTEHNPEINYND
jgi:hypothetical protein